MNIDIKVESVIDAVEKIKEVGGQIICGPFDIPIGKCAVVRDKWSNEYVILDMTKGKYVTDLDGNIQGIN
jgi:predicted enzyme related to lactoylglutathione lyase